MARWSGLRAIHLVPAVATIGTGVASAFVDDPTQGILVGIAWVSIAALILSYPLERMLARRRRRRFAERVRRDV